MFQKLIVTIQQVILVFFNTDNECHGNTVVAAFDRPASKAASTTHTTYVLCTPSYFVMNAEMDCAETTYRNVCRAVGQWLQSTMNYEVTIVFLCPVHMVCIPQLNLKHRSTAGTHTRELATWV